MNKWHDNYQFDKYFLKVFCEKQIGDLLLYDSKKKLGDRVFLRR